MKLKIADIDEKQLKNYLIAVHKIKNVPEARLAIALNKLKTGAQSNEARVFIIEFFLRHVVAFAAKYRVPGVSFAKLIKAGNQGLIIAVKKWPGESDQDFYQYVNWHVEGSVLSCLVKNCRTKVKEKGE